MVNPGAFQGARKAFLMGERDAYSQAVDDGYIAEAVAKIQRRFFKRFPVDLPDDVEPTAEELAAVNDEEIEPETAPPDPETMTKEEYAEALMVVDSRQRKIAFRRSQIKRWLSYQYMKDHDVDSKSNGSHNPYRALLYKLTGQSFVRPRARQPCNLWRKTRRDDIEARVKILAAEASTPKSGLAALRDKVARDMFYKLPEEERRRWKHAAQEESTRAQKLWEEEISSPPSTAPEDRQRCILGLVRFMQAILNLVCEATGWKASFIAGGPEPAHAGKLNIISVHSGKTAGDVPLDFGTLEREGYKKNFLPMYGRFLKKCYSVAECHARALKPEDSVSVQTTEAETEGVDVYPVEGPSEAVAKRSQALLDLRRTRLPPKKPKAKASPLSLVPKPSPAPSTMQSASTAAQGAPPAKAHGAPLDDRAPKSRTTPSVPSPDSCVPAAVSSYPSTPKETGLITPSTAPSPLPSPPLPPHLLPRPPSPPQSPSPSRPPSPSQLRQQPPSPQPPSLSRPLAAPTPICSPSSACPTSPPQSLVPSRPPSPPQSLVPSRPPSPPQSLVPSRPPSPPQSPVPSRPPSPPFLPPACLPSPPITADALSNDDLSGGSPSSSTPSPPAFELQPASGSGDSASPPLESVSASLRRSKRRHSVNLAATETRPAKKARSAKHSAATTPQNVPANADAPEWFTAILDMLQSRGLDGDECWMNLVQRWAAFEALEGYEGASRLSASARPSVISAWLHRKRSPSFRPDIDLRRYPKMYTDWWTSLQPKWRVVGKKILFDQVEGDWESLRRPGLNGVVNVLVSLFYWGCAVKEGKRSSKDWELFVNDCNAALTQLLKPAA